MKNLMRVGIAVVLFSAPAYAAEKDVEFFAGVQVPGKVTLTDAGSTGSSIINDPANVGTYGMRIGHGRLLGGEHTLAFNSNFLDSNSKAFIYNSNLRIQAPFPIVKPYATAGLGAVIAWGRGASDIGSRFAFNYGGGLKVMPGPVGIGFDVRGYTMPRVQSQTLNMAQVSLGIVIGF